ncbi:MAG: LL-diaminopimelate aminotransferase [bacterium]
MKITPANRLRCLPPYPFFEIDKARAKARAEGVDIIDLGIGDPDKPTPAHIVKAMEKAVLKPENYQYPSTEGKIEFRRTVAVWCKQRFNLDLDPDTQILSLMGSKEGIGHIPLAFVEPGEVVLVPSPGYPVYEPATIFAGGIPHLMPIREENNFLPVLEDIPESVLEKAKLIFINYPNNPTGATAPASFFKQVVEIAQRYEIVVCHDAAYSELYSEDNKPTSLMEVDGAFEVGLEFHSLSKTYNMTGWRIGFAIGNKDLVKGLTNIKSNLDSGVFQAVQEAAIAALTGPQDCVESMRKLYQGRRNVLVEGLRQLGWSVANTSGAFYVWIRVPFDIDSTTFCADLLKRCGIVATPGVGFGSHGEGYIRIALTLDEDRIAEAVERIKREQWW